jgi:CelD/BcsL family acetyltransferase involved in cellulose biosynthesis
LLVFPDVSKIDAVQNTRVVVIEHPEELEPYVAGWQHLAADAVESNVFYEPWMLMPALRLWSGEDKLVFVLIFTADGDAPAHRERLAGFFPLRYQTYYREFPVSTLKLWQYDYCFLSTPLVHKQNVGLVVAAFLEWLGDNPYAAALMEFRDIERDGPFHRALLEQLGQRQEVCVMDSYMRPMLTRRTDANAYLREALSKKRRKERARLRRRLSEMGRIDIIELEQGADVERWIAEFLALEAAGWKGRVGGAMKVDGASGDFFSTIAREAFSRGRLMMLGLYIDGRPAAMKCNFLATPGSFAFKIAYDETLGRFSPGVQLEIENIRRFHARRDLQWMDSCTAVENHFMMNHLWRDRKTIETVTIATGKWPGYVVVSLLPLRQRLRRTIKAAFLS